MYFKQELEDLEKYGDLEFLTKKNLTIKNIMKRNFVTKESLNLSYVKRSNNSLAIGVVESFSSEHVFAGAIFTRSILPANNRPAIKHSAPLVRALLTMTCLRESLAAAAAIKITRRSTGFVTVRVTGINL